MFAHAFAGLNMPDLNFIRAEIELVRMQAKVDGLCEERDRLVGDQRRKYPGTDKVTNEPIERRFR